MLGLGGIEPTTDNLAALAMVGFVVLVKVKKMLTKPTADEIAATERRQANLPGGCPLPQPASHLTGTPTTHTRSPRGHCSTLGPHTRSAVCTAPSAVAASSALFVLLLVSVPVWFTLTEMPQAAFPAERIRALAVVRSPPSPLGAQSDPPACDEREGVESLTRHTAQPSAFCQQGPGLYRLVIPVGSGAWAAAEAATLCGAAAEWQLPTIAGCGPRNVECDAVHASRPQPAEMILPAERLQSDQAAAAASWVEELAGLPAAGTLVVAVLVRRTALVPLPHHVY